MNISAGFLKGDSPYAMMAVKLLVAAVIFFSVIGFYFFYISPELESQEGQIDEMENAKVEIHQLEGEIGALEDEVILLRTQEAGEKDRVFKGTELIQMNRSINNFAAESNVKIISMQMRTKEKLEKTEGGGDMPMDDNGDMPMDDNGDMLMDDGGGMPIDDGGGDEFFTIPFSFTVKGGYLDYLTFRSQLANWSKAVNMQKEHIRAGEGRFKGVVTVNGVIQVVQKVKSKGRL